MNLLSIQVALPKEIEWQDTTVLTGIFKLAVPGPAAAHALGLVGDGQADPRYHGGVDKAVYGYGHDAYDWWHRELGRNDLGNGAFGENLTFRFLEETKIFIGDVFALGTCRLQAVQPRFPCFKLGIKFGDMGILKTFTRSQRPGVYFRVVQDGMFKPGDSLQLLFGEKEKVSIWDLWDVQLQGCRDEVRMRRMLAIPSLPSEWREKFIRKLGGQA